MTFLARVISLPLFYVDIRLADLSVIFLTYRKLRLRCLKVLITSVMEKL